MCDFFCNQHFCFCLSTIHWIIIDNLCVSASLLNINHRLLSNVWMMVKCVKRTSIVCKVRLGTTWLLSRWLHIVSILICPSSLCWFIILFTHLETRKFSPLPTKTAAMDKRCQTLSWNVNLVRSHTTHRRWRIYKEIKHRGPFFH